MAEKRKISIRKILQVFLTVVVSACCVVAIVSASKIEESKTVKKVVIHFKNDKRYHFIEEQEIMNLAIKNRHIDIEKTPLSRLDIHTMERLIRSNPWVAYAQVFIDNERVLHMYVTQRIPVARVFQTDGSSFYLDTTLSIMPLSANFIYYTTVVTNVPRLRNDSISWALRKDIISMVRSIQADSFWNAQVSQVIVDSAGMYELVPILGDHRIVFGDATDMKEKFGNLFAFYKNVLNSIGWDKYQTLDVRFKGQVVAGPSLPYSGPIDKAVTNMNWITSIVETEARNDAKDSADGAAVKSNVDQATKVTVPVKVAVKTPVRAKQPTHDAPVKANIAPAKKATVPVKISVKNHPPVKQVVNTAKKVVKPLPAKPKQKTKADGKANAKNPKQTDKTKATPKYSYPGKKDH